MTLILYDYPHISLRNKVFDLNHNPVSYVFSYYIAQLTTKDSKTVLNSKSVYQLNQDRKFSGLLFKPKWHSLFTTKHQFHL
jgi:hypothetical protein